MVYHKSGYQHYVSVAILSPQAIACQPLVKRAGREGRSSRPEGQHEQRPGWYCKSNPGQTYTRRTGSSSSAMSSVSRKRSNQNVGSRQDLGLGVSQMPAPGHQLFHRPEPTLTSITCFWTWDWARSWARRISVNIQLRRIRFLQENCQMKTKPNTILSTFARPFVTTKSPRMSWDLPAWPGHIVIGYTHVHLCKASAQGR